MICPNCKVEYEKGYKQCSDCNIDLVERADIPIHVNKISQTGLSMLKFGIVLLFVCIFELITLITLYDSNFFYRISRDSPGGGNLNPVVNLLLAFQFIISVMVIIYGFFSKVRK